jgi:hypothetical protein
VTETALIPFVDLRHNTGRAPAYRSIRAEWNCPGSGGVTLKFARLSDVPRTAEVILSEDMNFRAEVSQQQVLLKLPDDMLVELFGRKSTERFAEGADGTHTFVFSYALIIDGNIEMTGPVSIDHACIPEEIDPTIERPGGGDTQSKDGGTGSPSSTKSGIFMPAFFKTSGAPAAGGDGGAAFMSNENVPV